MAGLGGLVSGHLPGWISRFYAVLIANRVLGMTTHPTLTTIQANRITLLSGCAIVGIALIPLWRLPQHTAAPKVTLPRWSNPFLRRFLPAMAVWCLVTGAFPQFATIYFVRHLGLSIERMGSVFSISQLIQFVALLSAPLLFRRVGIPSGIMLTQLGTAASLGLLAVTHTPAQAAWVYWAYMATQYMNEPGIYSLLMDRVPSSEHNGASASTFFVSSSAQVVASAAAGAALARFGYSPVLAVIAVLAVVAAILFRRLPSTGLAMAAPAPDHRDALTTQLEP